MNFRTFHVHGVAEEINPPYSLLSAVQSGPCPTQLKSVFTRTEERAKVVASSLRFLNFSWELKTTGSNKSDFESVSQRSAKSLMMSTYYQLKNSRVSLQFNSLC